MAVGFALTGVDGRARRGRLETAHGTVQTPAFMPVGTAATVKALTPAMVAQAGAEMVLGNTYHLMLRPGAERVARLGGLHTFMRWPGPILTDSGGYQAMSLGSLAKVGEDGVRFRSHIDGAALELTPERAVEAQYLLDADVTMALDECTPWPIEKGGAAASMRRSMRWAERCRAVFRDRPGYGLFGIVQGGVHDDLRAESAETLAGMGFDGYAVGGLSVGEPKELHHSIAAHTAALLPPERPRYLMGVGSPEDLVEAVAFGYDLFDCALPTRVARNGGIYHAGGRYDVTTARFRTEPGPLEEGCDCLTCRSFSAAYVHHLFRARELLAHRLATVHNLRFYQRLMARLREAVLAGTFEEVRRAFHSAYTPTKEEVRLEQRRRWEAARRER